MRKFVDRFFIYAGLLNLAVMAHFYSYLIQNKEKLIWSAFSIYFVPVITMHILPAAALSLAVSAFLLMKKKEGSAEILHKIILLFFCLFFSFWLSANYFAPKPVYMYPFAVILTAALIFAGYRFYSFTNELLKVAGYLSLFYIIFFFYRLDLLTEQKAYSIHNLSRDSQPLDPNRPHPPTIVIVYDELSRNAILNDKGDISDEFPAFKTLSEESIWYKNAATNYDASDFSVPSFLSGLYVQPDNVLIDDPEFRDKPNLFNMAASKYKVELIGSFLGYCKGKPDFVCRDGNEFYSLHPFRLTSFLLRSFINLSGFLPDEFNPKPSLGQPYFIEWQNNLFLKTINGKKLDGRLIYFHSILPHAPYLYGPDGSKNESFKPNDFYSVTPDADSIKKTLKLYKDQLKYTDSLLGEAVKLLKESGAWDEINFVVTSDHGVGWEPEIRGRIGGRVNDQIAFVPFFIKPAGLKRGELREEYYQHVNFLPTVLEMMNLKPPEKLHGYSVLKGKKTTPYLVLSRKQWWKKETINGGWEKVENIAPLKEN